MADLLQRDHPLRAREAAFAALPPGVDLTVEPFVAMSDLRVPGGAGAAAAAEVLGSPLPAVAGTWAPHAHGWTVWLGPNEWLVVGAASAPEVLEERLRAAVVPHGGSAVDVSAQRTVLRLRGAHARDLLAGGCSLDLHPRAFPRGACAQTTLARSGVVLLSLGAGDDFALLVRSSFARYLADWLLDAALEHAPHDG